MRAIAVVFIVASPLLVACGAQIAVGTHATKPMSPADGAGDWEIAGGPIDVPPRVPGPELAPPAPNVKPVLFRVGATPLTAPTTPVWPTLPPLRRR